MFIFTYIYGYIKHILSYPFEGVSRVGVVHMCHMETFNPIPRDRRVHRGHRNWRPGPPRDRSDRRSADCLFPSCGVFFRS